jgi:uncharacterized membrane protein
MIVERLDAPNAREFRLLPNRSLTPRGTRLLLGALGLTMFAVAGISAGQGNVYAPAFALVQLVAIAGCFAAVGRRLDCEERIALSADALTVERRTGAGSVEAARFHPYWVRLQTAGRRGARLVLSSHGRDRGAARSRRARGIGGASEAGADELAPSGHGRAELELIRGCL